MVNSLCHSCRQALKHALRPRQHTPQRSYSTTKLDISALLSKPTWSVRSLLPPSQPSSPSSSPSPNNASNPSPSTSSPEPEITTKQLHHLLRLSALPLPTSPASEAAMLSTLSSQLHFVRSIQSVPTSGVEPLQSIRDESPDGIAHATIRLDDLKETLAREKKVGRMGRPRRDRSADVVLKGATGGDGGEEGEWVKGLGWDVFREAAETVDMGGRGRYFVVRSGKGVEVAKDKGPEKLKSKRKGKWILAF